MDWSGCELVEVIPGKVSGVPLIRRTRVPVELVIAIRDGGETVEEIAYNQDLKTEDIQAVLAYRDSLEPANGSCTSITSLGEGLRGLDCSPFCSTFCST